MQHIQNKDNLSLRYLSESDFTSYAELVCELQPVYNRDDFNKRLTTHRRLRELDQAYILHIFNPQSEIVGSVDITILGRFCFQVGQIGCLISNKHRGKKYSLIGVKLGIDFAFKNLGLKRLEAMFPNRGGASEAIVHSLDFVYEGVRKNYYLNPTSKKWQDVYTYYIQQKDIPLETPE